MKVVKVKKGIKLGEGEEGDGTQMSFEGTEEHYCVLQDNPADF